MKKFFTLIILFGVQIGLEGQSVIYAINSGNWSAATSWINGAIPTGTDNVEVGVGFTITVDASVQCKDMTIYNGGLLKADSASCLNVKRHFINNGTFQCGKGKVAFNGNVPQYIGGSSATCFYNLDLASANTLSLSVNTSLMNRLSITSGTFITTGFQFTLLSSATASAAIGPIPNGCNITGNITVQRYISSASTGWRFLSSPVRTTLTDWTDDFITSGFPGSAYPNYYWCSVYSYDETVPGTSDYGYTIPASANDSLLPGKGYWCWIGPTPDVVSVTGPPAKFSHTFNVSLTTDSGKGHDGWNMIANPYPSPIDWDAPSWTKVGISNAIYVWDPVLEQYQSYVNGVGANGGSNIISSSQAFWIEASQQNPVLVSDENTKTTLDKAFLRPTMASKHVIRLMLGGNGFKDETVLALDPATKKEALPAEDAKKLYSDNPAAPSICSLADMDELVINSLPFENSDLSVPVKVKVGASGTYSISKDPNMQLPENWCVYLEDKLTGKKMDLRTMSPYSFYISDTTSAARFLIHITKPVAALAKNTKCSYSQDGQAKITYAAKGWWTAEWKNGNDSIIATHFPAGNCDSLMNLAPGAYFVTVNEKTGSCRSVKEKFIVYPAEAIAVNGFVNDNQCQKESKGTIQAKVSNGTAPYTYNWSNSATTPVVKDLAAGSYTLHLTDAVGCKDTSVYEVKTVSKLQAAFAVENDADNIYMNDLVVFSNQSSGYSNCIWSYDNHSWMNDKNPSYIYSLPGTYTVTLSASDEHCSSTVQKIIHVKDPVNHNISVSDAQIEVQQQNEEAVVIFNLTEETPSVIRVFSMDGKLISTANVQAWKNKESVKLGDSHGVYIVSVEANGRHEHRKVMK